MKKHFISLSAIVIALVAFSFTKPAVDAYVFEFKSTLAYTIANVQNTANTVWEYKGKNLALCTGQLVKACRVAVTEDYVNDPAAPTALSGITITATESSANIAYVSAITDPTVNVKSNKP